MVSYLNLRWLLAVTVLLGSGVSQAGPISNMGHKQTGEESRLVLFGVQSAWNTSNVTWTAVDDRVRGGSSVSHLIPSESQNGAIFYGTLDTKTLGGAGFASQSTQPVSNSSYAEKSPDNLHWDLSDYDGIELRLGSFDKKTYTLTLKDTLPTSKRADGRQRSTVSWEADFKPAEIPAPPEGDTLVWLPWSKFRATYRGRDKPDADPLKVENIRRFSLMMRSFFEKQEGDFRLEILWLAAVKRASSDPRPQRAEL